MRTENLKFSAKKEGNHQLPDSTNVGAWEKKPASVNGREMELWNSFFKKMTPLNKAYLNSQFEKIRAPINGIKAVSNVLVEDEKIPVGSKDLVAILGANCEYILNVMRQ